jgi:hypothetical protein
MKKRTRRFGRRPKLAVRPFRFETDDESVVLMNQEWGTNRTKEEWIRWMRAGMAINFYLDGDATRGAARRLSGLDREAFARRVEEEEDVRRRGAQGRGEGLSRDITEEEQAQQDGG